MIQGHCRLPVANRFPPNRLAKASASSALFRTNARWSGRTMARTGLRMMPTFPSPPLRFRTVGFPQYGSKAGLSDRAFPGRASVKLAPSMPVARSGLPPSFVLSPRQHGPSALSRSHLLGGAPPFKRHSSLYPRGPRSGSGYVVPYHHHLSGPMRPTRRHIAISPHSGLYAMPSLCGSA